MFLIQLHKLLSLHNRRVSCFYLWDTPEGGPCLLRPVPTDSFDSPAKGLIQRQSCVDGVDTDRKCVIGKSCKGAYCDEKNILHNGKIETIRSEAVGPWKEDMSKDELQSRKAQGWENQFGFPWEIGMYWKFTTGGNDFKYIFFSYMYIYLLPEKVSIIGLWDVQAWMRTLEKSMNGNGHS